MGAQDPYRPGAGGPGGRPARLRPGAGLRAAEQRPAARSARPGAGHARRDRQGQDRRTLAKAGGILRAALPQWLETPALRPFVAALRPAHPRHGGAGAWYVILRRVRE
ncbi:Smr/MutS family protein [Hankyongella ginsenosidimutans]|uniref:Smr/MutS family protein n=1 Tax=Hankyongella ginsenosidimutans TaxID=1763828 RepID=UPI003CCC8A41